VNNDWQQQAQMVIEQGSQAIAGQMAGEMWIDARPEEGFLRLKLRNIQPPQATAQLVSGFAQVLATGGAAFGLEVKQHIAQEGEK